MWHKTGNIARKDNVNANGYFWCCFVFEMETNKGKQD